MERDIPPGTSGGNVGGGATGFAGVPALGGAGAGTGTGAGGGTAGNCNNLLDAPSVCSAEDNCKRATATAKIDFILRLSVVMLLINGKYIDIQAIL